MSNEIAKTEDVVKSNLPAYMQEDADNLGYDPAVLAEYIRPPRIKIIQGMSAKELKEEFGEGAIILTPSKTLITKTDEPFFVTPLMFYREYIKWNPLKLKDTLPMIAEQSFDPDSVLARKCKTKSMWFEDCPDAPGSQAGKEYQCRNQEHLNFILKLETDNASNGIEALVSFTRASFADGANFASLIHMRKSPMYGCRFAMKRIEKKNNQGEWYGLALQNPDDHPFVPAEQYEINKETNRMLMDKYAEGLIAATMDDDVDESSIVEGSAAENSEY